jgi:hypothetical protein
MIGRVFDLPGLLTIAVIAALIPQVMLMGSAQSVRVSHRCTF